MKGDDNDQQGEFSCSKCDKADSDDMVQCDACDKWLHFECVGVDVSIAEQDWLCPSCLSKSPKETASDSENFQSPLNAANKVSVICTHKTPSVDLDSSSMRKRNVEIELQRLEEERKLNLLYIQRKYAIISASDHPDEENIDDTAQERKLSFQQEIENHKKASSDMPTQCDMPNKEHGANKSFKRNEKAQPFVMCW